MKTLTKAAILIAGAVIALAIWIIVIGSPFHSDFCSISTTCMANLIERGSCYENGTKTDNYVPLNSLAPECTAYCEKYDEIGNCKDNAISCQAIRPHCI